MRFRSEKLELKKIGLDKNIGFRKIKQQQILGSGW